MRLEYHARCAKESIEEHQRRGAAFGAIIVFLYLIPEVIPPPAVEYGRERYAQAPYSLQYACRGGRYQGARKASSGTDHGTACRTDDARRPWIMYAIDATVLILDHHVIHVFAGHVDGKARHERRKKAICAAGRFVLIMVATARYEAFTTLCVIEFVYHFRVFQFFQWLTLIIMVCSIKTIIFIAIVAIHRVHHACTTRLTRSSPTALPFAYICEGNVSASTKKRRAMLSRGHRSKP